MGILAKLSGLEYPNQSQTNLGIIRPDGMGHPVKCAFKLSFQVQSAGPPPGTDRDRDELFGRASKGSAEPHALGVLAVAHAPGDAVRRAHPRTRGSQQADPSSRSEGERE